MTELQSLYQKKGEIIHEMRDIYAQAEKEQRGLNVDEEAKWAKLDDDFKVVQSRIEKGEAVRNLLSEYETDMSNMTQSAQEARDAFSNKTVTKTDDKPSVTYRDSWYKLMGATPNPLGSLGDSLSREERNVVLRGYMTAAQLAAEQRGTDTQKSSTASLGGYLSPEEWANEVIETMLAYGGMMEAGNIIRTRGGDTLHFPTEDVTTQKSTIVGQGTAPAVADITWGETTMSAFTYNTGIIKIAEELYAEDDTYNVLSRVSNICASRNYRAVNEHLTTGAGTTEPYGVVTQASSSGVTAASAVSVARTELLDLIHSVDPAYRIGPKVGLMFNDSTLAAIRKLSIGSGDDRPLWVPSMRDGAPDTIEGYRYWINQDVASMASQAKSILFGNFDKYYIRMVRGFTLSRSDQRYWDERVVAYFATMRLDGKLLDTAAVKYFQNAT